MTETPKSQQHAKPDTGLGLSNLSMNEIAPAERLAEDDIPRQKGRSWLTITAVLLAVALVGFFAHLLGNLSPGQNAQEQLRKSLEVLPAWQRGDVMQAEMVSSSELRLVFSDRLATSSEEDRTTIRQATQQAFEVFAEIKPNRDLKINGYQGNEQIVWGQFRPHSSLIGSGGEKIRDFTIKVKGDPEGGLQESFSGSKGSSAGK
jgi:hypothetical protein